MGREGGGGDTRQPFASPAPAEREALTFPGTRSAALPGACQPLLMQGCLARAPSGTPASHKCSFAVSTLPLQQQIPEPAGVIKFFLQRSSAHETKYFEGLVS